MFDIRVRPSIFRDVFFSERPKTERDETPPQQRGQQAYDPGMADQSQKRARQEELVRAHWQDVPVLQVAGRPGQLKKI